MNQLTTVGLDLAKDVIAACVLDLHGAVVERRVLKREAFQRWAEQLPVCTVAMEACGSAHHWGRWFAARGHTVRLIAPQFVAAFRKGGKNDAADAEAVAIAARQPTMRFVPIKTIDQQTILAWHCAREGWKEERTALMNRVRGLLTEFGIVIARSSDRFLAELPRLTEDPRLPARVAALVLGRHECAYLARAVSGTLDVDRCDYLLRDSHMTGVRYGIYDLDWLLRALAFGR